MTESRSSIMHQYADQQGEEVWFHGA